jgi:tRNA(adenine34) deaminase
MNSDAQSAAASSDVDVAMMRLALDEARSAAAIGEVPIGAVVYRTLTGEVLSRAHNLRERDKNPAAHAEFLAIVEACRVVGDWRLNDCSLAVTLRALPDVRGADRERAGGAGGVRRGGPQGGCDPDAVQPVR